MLSTDGVLPPLPMWEAAVSMIPVHHPAGRERRRGKERNVFRTGSFGGSGTAARTGAAEDDFVIAYIAFTERGASGGRGNIEPGNVLDDAANFAVEMVVTMQLRVV